MKIKINLKAIYVIMIMSCLTTFTGCKKFLDEKPKSGLQVPVNLQDYQALLDAYTIINRADPNAAELSADDYYLTDAALSSRTEYDRSIYTWQNSGIFMPGVNDWQKIYLIVYRTNTVLNNIDQVPKNAANNIEWNNIKGQAAFLRAKAFLQALGNWALPYDEKTSNTDLGIPIRLETDFNQPSTRTSVSESYTQVITDLKIAIANLPNTPLHVVRPSKPAAYALMARTYLYMRKFDEALHYADSCLILKPDLLDYNIISSTPAYPMPQFSNEVLHDTYMSTPTVLGNTYARIIPELYAQYEINDLRKNLFFKSVESNVYAFRGSYEKSAQLFTGLATDEIYLTRAECYAREGNLTKANLDLNALLKKRYKTGTFTDQNITTQSTLLNKILLERRKELLMRGLRWMDIKRLNKENYNIVLKRTYNGNNYTLQPNDRRFALPIPDDIVSTSNVLQNVY
jgi:tetratricopeptide (TPR) repeat protein